MDLRLLSPFGVIAYFLVFVGVIATGIGSLGYVTTAIGLLVLVIQEIYNWKRLGVLNLMGACMAVGFFLSEKVLGRTSDGMMGFGVVGIILANVGIAAGICTWQGARKGVAWIPFVALSGWLGFKIYQGVPPENIFAHMDISRNGVSAYLIPLGCLGYFLHRSVTGGKVPLLPAIIMFAFSVWAKGRGGVIASALLLALIGVYRVYKTKVNLLMLIGLMLSVTTIIASIGYWYPRLESSWTSNETAKRFEVEGTTDSARSEVIKDFVNSLTVKSLLIGRDPEKELIAANLGYNYHNSFLHLQASCGLGGIVIIVMLCVAMARLPFSSLVLTIAAMCLIVRVFTDHVMFISPFDSLAFAIIGFAFGGRSDGIKKEIKKDLPKAPRLDESAPIEKAML